MKKIQKKSNKKSKKIQKVHQKKSQIINTNPTIKKKITFFSKIENFWEEKICEKNENFERKKRFPLSFAN